MTVFELRSHVAVGIDDLEDALAALKADGLIEVDDGERTLIKPDDRVVPEPGKQDTEASALGRLRERLGL
jgi:DNA-binding FadR family transcriptional regulator